MAGGVCCYESAATFVNCTIAGNSANDVGGGIAVRRWSDVLLQNCVVADKQRANRARMLMWRERPFRLF